MRPTPAETPEGTARVAGLLVHQADIGAVPGHPEPLRFGDARSGWPILHPSPTPFQSVDLDLPTKQERHRKIYLRTKCPHCCPACRRTSQKRAAQIDIVQPPSLEANG